MDSVVRVTDMRTSVETRKGQNLGFPHQPHPFSAHTLPRDGLCSDRHPQCVGENSRLLNIALPLGVLICCGLSTLPSEQTTVGFTLPASF